MNSRALTYLHITGMERRTHLRVPKLALRSLGAEAGEVVGTQYLMNMAVFTQGTFLAEPLVIPRAVLELENWLQVQEQAFLVAAVPELGVEIAHGHLADVILVQEVAAITLPAEASKPVFAHHQLLTLLVPEWA